MKGSLFCSKTQIPRFFLLTVSFHKVYVGILNHFNQAEKPLTVFLYFQLRELIRSLLERFVQPHVLESNASPYKLINLDLKKQENLLPIEFINVGFGAKSVIRNITTTEKTMECQFRKDVQIYLISFVQKIFQRCPLKYKLT